MVIDTGLEIYSKAYVHAFFRKQESAPTIGIFGPSGSTKSTLLTEVLPPSSNMLLSLNIGMKQTSLFNTKLMLNGNIPEDEVFIRCKIKPLDKVLLKIHFFNAICDYIYKHRDELDEVAIDDSVLKSVLDPDNRAYHFLSYVQKHQGTVSDEFTCPTLDELQAVLQELYEALIPGLEESVRELVKKSKTITPKPKKEDLYKQELSERLAMTEDTVAKIYEWFENLYAYILHQISKLSIWLDDAKEYLVLCGRVDSTNVQTLIREAYDKQSPYSLVIEELAYAVRPSNQFLESYTDSYTKCQYLGKVLKLNILDTPGLTQISDEKTDIQNALDYVLGLKFDALLFLCSSDEKPTVYAVCKELLLSKKKKFANKPFVMIRTKADIVLREKMLSYLRAEHGVSQLEKEHIQLYAQRAYDEYVGELQEEAVTLSEEKLACGSNQLIDFISLARDLTEQMNEFLDEPLVREKIFKILINLSLSVHQTFMPSSDEKLKYCLQSHNPDVPTLQSRMDGYMDEILNTFAEYMVTKNSKEKNQYLQWRSTPYPFHGRSVTTFIYKHRMGIGHETNASVYENFKLYIRNMLERWIQAFFKDWELNFDIDFSNLSVADQYGQRAVNEAPAELTRLFKYQKSQILSDIAKLLSYDEFKEEFNRCYTYASWDAGFRNNLLLFETKFSDKDFWKNGLKKYLKLELDKLLGRMYFYD